MRERDTTTGYEAKAREFLRANHLLCSNRAQCDGGPFSTTPTCPCGRLIVNLAALLAEVADASGRNALEPRDERA
jgi:hypothetical protein